MPSFQPRIHWRSLVLIKCVLFVLSAAVPAHAAVISGRVFDSETDLFIESARISVVGTDLSTVSQRGGRYRLTGIEPGIHTISVSATGYPVVTSQIEIADANEELTLNLNLFQEDVHMLSDFVVEGALLGQARALDIRRASAEFREVVASDAFGQFVDRNPGEALQRVAGITVERDQGDGSFLIIRGGAPELTAVEIDGVNLATPEADGRRVNLNVITVDQLERIEVSKTWVPRQKANVVGGTVNMITRSALDRGERFGSIEGAVTHREVNDDQLSWRTALTFGDVFDQRKWDRLGNLAIGVQFSVNLSDDYSGSNTANWIWDTRRTYPFRTRPGEDRLFGYTLGEVRSRNFQINRQRQGFSARVEGRWRDRHEIFLSMSHNEFKDTEVEQIFSRQITGVADNYAGTTRLTPAILERLGGDPADPFNQQRLAAVGLQAALTFSEALQLGELQFDPERKLFTRGGAWPMPMDRTFIHTYREDRIDTFQIGGRHDLAEGLKADWRVYRSEAQQESEQHWLRFYVDGATGLGASPIAGIRNPYIEDLSESQVIYDKASFFLREYISGPRGRQHNFLWSNDDRTGAEINVEKRFEIGATRWKTLVGATVDKRDKLYEINNNSSGFLMGSLDPEQWPLGRMSLADPLFDGGELEAFSRNFGENLRFGPSFHPENTLRFLQNPGEYGANFVQSIDHVNNNFTSRVTNNYEATEDINGYYLQQNLSWGKWTFIFGARYESTRNTFTNLEILTRNPDFPQIRFINPTQWKILSESFGDIFVESVVNERRYSHLLPAFHVNRRFGENRLLRASVTQTIARPLFSDLVPREVPSISSGNFGNDIRLPAFDLRPMESTNYDISLDQYIDPIGLVSIALFYKDLDGPIYDETRVGVGPNEETEFYALRYDSRNAAIDPNNIPPGARIVNNQSYNFSRKRNAGQAYLMGVELTFDRKFNFLPGFWNGFGINSNVSWFDSKAELLTEGRVGEKVRLFKQPDMTGNLSVYYEKYGVFARLSYNVRGRFLNSIAGGTALQQDLGPERIDDPLNSMDIWVDRTARLDFTFRYSVNQRFQVFAEVINLTNEDEFRFRGDTSRPQSREYTNRVFTLGARWNL